MLAARHDFDTFKNYSRQAGKQEQTRPFKGNGDEAQARKKKNLAVGADTDLGVTVDAKLRHKVFDYPENANTLAQRRWTRREEVVLWGVQTSRCRCEAELSCVVQGNKRKEKSGRAKNKRDGDAPKPWHRICQRPVVPSLCAAAHQCLPMRQ